MIHSKRLKNSHSSISILLFFPLVVILFFSAKPISWADGVLSGHLIVRIGTESDVKGIENDYATSSTDRIPGASVYSLETPAGSDDITFANELMLDSRVQDVEFDQNLELPEIHGYPFHFPVDRTFRPGAYLNQNAYQQVNAGNNMKSWQFPNYSSASIVPSGPIVAILDTGAAFNHSAISSNLLAGWNSFDPGSPPEDTPNSGSSLYTGHGTMIAALITRLAPNSQILPVRILDGDGNGSLMSVLKGVQFAIVQGARVINMSFGTTQYSRILDETLSQARESGILIVAAAGNSGKNQISYPAAYEAAISVASITAKGHKSSFSNYGTKLCVVAPGEHIRSAYWNGGYATWSGTSFAAPFVTAQVALILDSYSTLGAEAVEERIRETAHSLNALNPLYTGQLGNGLIDIQASLSAVYDH